MIQFTNIEPVTLAFIVIICVLTARFVYTRISAARFIAKTFRGQNNRAVAWLSVKRTGASGLFFFSGLVVLAIGLLGPAWGVDKQPLTERKLDILFMVDLSASMNARDVEPSRLRFAKKAIGAFAEAAGGSRLGILAFAGEPFYYCPFTSDLSAFREFLEGLETRNIGHKGTNFAKAFARAEDIVQNKSVNAKVVLFFSDGENHGGLPDAPLTDAAGNRVPTFIFGVGTAKGGLARIWHPRAGRLVPIRQGSTNVHSKYDGQSLQTLADTLKARYSWLSQTPAALYNLNSYVPEWSKGLTKKGFAQSFTPRGWLFALISFGLFSLSFGCHWWRSTLGTEETSAMNSMEPRPHNAPKSSGSHALLAALLWAASWALIIGGSTPLAAQAGWVDPVYEQLQKANALMTQKKPEAALSILEQLAKQTQAHPQRRGIILFNKGNAYYALGNYDMALADYYQALGLTSEPALKSKILNNIGNALAQKNQKHKALEAYRAALDARKNPEAIRNIERLFQAPPKRPDQKGENSSPHKENSTQGSGTNSDLQNKPKQEPIQPPGNSKGKKGQNKEGQQDGAAEKKLAEQFLRQSGNGRVNRSNSHQSTTGEEKFW